MSPAQGAERTLELDSRLPTGIQGLDVLLGGGLLRAGLYLIEGVPGSGKTILGSQIAFNQARRGGRVLFITVVAESHAKLLGHLSKFDFFDAAQVPKNILMLSGYAELAEKGLDGLLRSIVEAARLHEPQMLVIEGFASVRAFSPGRPDLGNFVHQLNILASAINITVLILSPTNGNEDQPEHTLVDCVIELQRTARGLRRAREIEVHKMRGGRHLTGRHVFVIEQQGIHIFPRLESLVMDTRIAAPAASRRFSTGIPTLDSIVGGGLTSGSATSLLGAPGVGKTLIGLSFLSAGADAGEPGLYLGFYEGPERLFEKAAGVGLNLRQHVGNGRLRFEWFAPLEILIDQIAEDIQSIVKEHGTKRVFIDGVEGFALGAMHPERVPTFLTALTIALREAGVTTLLSEELPLFTSAVDSKALSMSALVENIILLRFYELDAELHRLVSIIKLRESGFDPGIREFFITADGIVISDRIVGMEQILQGSPRVSDQSIAASKRARTVTRK
jgi:circadian clock protein KaiC